MCGIIGILIRSSNAIITKSNMHIRAHLLIAAILYATVHAISIMPVP